MYRLGICCFVVIMSAACLVRATPLDPRMPVTKLTSEQKKRWQELRKRSAKEPYIIVGFLKKPEAWQIAAWNTKFDTYRWQAKLDLWPRDEKEVAVATAKEIIIKDNTVKVTALVDLFSGEFPRVVSYYTRDESGIYTLLKPPSPKIGASMKTFLLGIQAEQAKR